MKKIKNLFVALCAFALFVTPVSANTGVDVTASLEETTITYEVNTTDPITNGRVAITYNENELELVNVVEGELFDVEDVNLDEEAVDGMKTVYFAFASADAYTGEETLALTLVFEADDSMAGKEVTITTVFEELANPEVIEKDDSTITIEIPEKEVDDNQNNNQQDNNQQDDNNKQENNQTQNDSDKVINDGVDTGDHYNIGFYVVALVFTIIILVLAFIRNRKEA